MSWVEPEAGENQAGALPVAGSRRLWLQVRVCPAIPSGSAGRLASSPAGAGDVLADGLGAAAGAGWCRVASR